MRILHYSLGLPPYRTGGLTKYSIDLALEQSSQGHEVSVLYPGKIGVLFCKTRIQKNPNFNDLKIFELYNPLPVPLIFGIDNLEYYCKHPSENVYKKFLDNFNFDVVHFHTFMGIHVEFLKEISRRNIRIIYTTHDYFGVWPKPNLLNDFSNEDIMYAFSSLSEQLNPLSRFKMTIMQSHVYKKSKNTKFVSILRRKTKQSLYREGDYQTMQSKFEEIEKKYAKLRKKYSEYFDLVTEFHFNSHLSKMIFGEYVDVKSSSVINITHSDIKDHRLSNTRLNRSEKVRLLFIGGPLPYKGYPYLVQVLDKIDSKSENHQFELIVTGFNDTKKYVNGIDSFKSEQMEKVYASVDLVIVPSMWYETFGFATLEALSFGKPVIVSNHVGSRDLVGELFKGKLIFNDRSELEATLESIINDPTVLRKIEEEIKSKNDIVFLMSDHSKLISELYVSPKQSGGTYDGQAI